MSRLRQTSLLILLGAMLLLTACGDQSSVTTATPAPTHSGHHDETPTPTALPAVTPVLTITPGATTIPRYGLLAQNFTLSGAYTNPWEQVRVTLTLSAPSGQQVTVEGFSLASGTWQARFSPAEVGTWSWRGEITNGEQTNPSQGSFNVVPSDWPGFVRANSQNPLRWVFDSGAPYYPLGIGDCLLDADHSGSPLDNLGFDGGFRQPGDPDYGRITDLDTYLRAYSTVGVNLFRLSVDNCSFKLYQSIAPSGNVYLAQEGLWGDELVLKLRQYGLRTYLTLFGFQPPYPTDTGDRDEMAAVERYVQYVVNRYGELVDFWELMNEFPNPPAAINDDWYSQVAGYLRRVDPYHYPISTSWPRPDLPAIDMGSAYPILLSVR